MATLLSVYKIIRSRRQDSKFPSGITLAIIKGRLSPSQFNPSNIELYPQHASVQVHKASHLEPTDSCGCQGPLCVHIEVQG
jgi:hypothetical protein